MIEATLRFHGYNSLRRLHAKGQTIRGNALSLKVYTYQNRQLPRIAVIVSRKVSKSAVIRNRIRRRIYEQVRLELDAIPAGSDIAIMVFSDQFAMMPAQQLASQVKQLLQQLR